MGEVAHDDRFAVELRSFGPTGISAILIILAGNFLFSPLSAILILAWAWRARLPWRELGLARPRSWIATLAAGLIIGVLLKLVLKALVMPLLGAPPVNAAYHFIAGNLAILPAMIFMIIVVAGVGEEILFRGYMFERLRRLLGDGRAATIAILIGTSAVFAVAHLPDQGVPGAQQAAITGLIFGTMYLVTRTLWLAIATHAVFDVTAVLIIYFDVETQIARSVFG